MPRVDKANLCVWTIIALCQPASIYAKSISAIPYQHAECLRDNANAYLSELGDPAMIFTGFCTLGIFDPSVQEISQATTTNALGSLIIVLDDGTKLPGNEMSHLLILSGSQLACLRDRFEHIVTKVRGHSQQKAGTSVEVAMIDFSRC